ncbi:MAG TPA: hypothetical protein EYH16_04805 [Leucothrix mucor]|nr:hypothetical protein [Leucothrix mucor]
MSAFEFTLATKADDASLRERMSHDAMEGTIDVSFRREPCYFAGAGVQGETIQIIKCVDKKKQCIAGIGARMTSDVYINGLRQRMGYLSDLRAAPDYRKSTLLARGYRYLRQLHQADPVPLYTTVILDGNQQALDNLTDARAGLPRYQNKGRILTPAIHLDFKHKPFKLSGVEIQLADKQSLNEVFEFVQKQYAKKQFAPYYQASDLEGARLKGLRPEDIYVARKNQKIVGVVAAWDQRAFRQTHIEGYNGGLKLIRPFYNMIAKFTPLKALPDKGKAVPYFYLALTAIKGDNPDVFKALLSKLYDDKRNGEWHYFIAGLHERSPLQTVLSEFRSIKAAGHLFIVHYPDESAFFNQLDARIPHIEMGAI